MAGPYDYTINIPQPPAQNFLQSLLGIQQLKGLQQQSQLAEQQAAIQQQQAAFQQQMQPLEMARIKAATDASNASVAESGARKGLIANQSEAAKFELDQKKNFQADMNKLASDPSKWTADKFMELGMKYPQSDWINLAKMRNTMPTKVTNFGDNLGQQLVLSSQIGDTKTGNKLLEDALNVAKSDPELNSIVPKIEQLKDQYAKYPEQSATIAAMGLQMFSPEKAKAMFGAIEERNKSEETKAKTQGQLLENRIKQYEADNGISLKDIQKNKEEKFKLEAAERAHIESNPFVRKYVDSRTAFEMMKEAAPNASGDEVLLTQFVKMGDPGSVVSVTEKGGVRNVTLSDYVASLQSKLASDGSLGDAKRKELKDQAFKMLQAPQKQYKEYQNNLEPVYRERGLNPKNIFVLPSSEQMLEEAKKQAAGPTGAINTGTLPVAPASGQSAEEARIRSMLRPAAGFGNTMTPSQIQPQGGTFQGTPSDVDAILKQYAPR